MKLDVSLLHLMKDMEEAARAAEHIMLNPTSLGIESKGDHDYVTECDKAVQATVMSYLSLKYPAIPFVAEEKDNDEADRLLEEGCFVIDPIDGTLNFMNGIPLSCCCIAYVEGKRALAGVVHAPKLGETYTAYEGGGAYLNGERIEAVRRDLCLGMLIAEDIWRADTFGVREKMLSVRTLGSCALSMCWVAAGRGSAYVAVPQAKAWDMAASSIVVRESGLCFVDMAGDPMNVVYQGQFVCCLEEDVEDVLYTVRKCEAAFEQGSAS